MNGWRWTYTGFAACLAVALTLVGCVSSPSRANASDSKAPDWVAGASKKYPNAAYLLGRGVGSTPQEAQNRARGELAAVFEVRVQVVTENTTEVASRNGAEQVSTAASQKVSAKTDKVISGIEMPEIWRDPVTQEVHALAVLSRAKAAAGLREEIARIDREVLQAKGEAESTGDALLKLGALQRAMDTAVQRDGFQASLKVVEPSGTGVEAPWPQAAIRSEMDRVLKGVKIMAEVRQAEGAPEFERLLNGGLAAAGFLAERGERADLALAGSMVLSDLGKQGAWHWMRGSVEVALVERGTGRVRGSKTWPVKASAQDAATARSRVLMEVEKLLGSELRPAIIEFAGK